ALSIMVRLANERFDSVRKNVDWLVAQSETKELWGEIPSGQHIDPAFYAMSALLQYDRMATTKDSRLPPIIQKTVNRNLDQVRYVPADGGMKDKHRSGWAWGDIANTAAAVAALLNSGQLPTSPSIQMGVQWLLAQATDDWWGSETPIV